MALREILAAETPSLPEVKRERISRTHRKIVEAAVRILVERYPHLNEQEVLEYVCGCPEEKLRQDPVRTWFRSGILSFGSGGCDTFLALSSSQEEGSSNVLAQEALHEEKELMEDMERAYGIDFGPHEDEFFAQQVRDLRFDLLQRALDRDMSVDALAQQNRQSIAQEIVKVHISENRSVPSSLQLLVGNSFVQEVKEEDGEIEKMKLPPLLRTALEERDRDRNERKREVRDSGMHSRIAEKRIARIHGEKEQGFAMAARSALNIQASAREGAKSIMSFFRNDPREVYDYFVDIDGANEIISKEE